MFLCGAGESKPWQERTRLATYDIPLLLQVDNYVTAVEPAKFALVLGLLECKGMRYFRNSKTFCVACCTSKRPSL